MNLKEVLRGISHNSTFLEKLWIILQWNKTKLLALQFTDVEYAQKLFKRKYGHELNLDDPESFDEKMWFLKLSNRDPLLTQCSDKHAVREYIVARGYGNILKTEFACFKNADEIDFDCLPSPCYLKCNHASGMNLVYAKERNLHVEHIRWKFNYLLKQQPYYLSREWNYKNIPPRIVCEEVLSSNNGHGIFPELQFFCFHGEALFLIYNLGLADEKGYHSDPTRWALWPDWSLVEEAKAMNHNVHTPGQPENYVDMLRCAEDLSKPFPFVRVDLFSIDGRMVFNELTFYSGGGFTLSKTKIIQDLCGKKINLDGYAISDDATKRRTWAEVKRGQ